MKENIYMDNIPFDYETRMYTQKERRTAMKGTRISKLDVLKNKFYVGSNQVIQSGWGFDNMESAIEKAKKLAQESEGDTFIVQIVKVIRQPEAPLVVEDVK